MQTCVIRTVFLNLTLQLNHVFCAVVAWNRVIRLRQHKSPCQCINVQTVNPEVRLALCFIQTGKDFNRKTKIQISTIQGGVSDTILYLRSQKEDA